MADKLTIDGGIQELAIRRNREVQYIYFARLGGQWIDLAPFGNRMPTSEELTKVAADALGNPNRMAREGEIDFLVSC
jgi:hypothetical protein